MGYDFLYASEDVLNSVHGPCAPVLDAWSLLSSLAAVTRRIGLCGAIKPGLRSPLVAARMIGTVSLIAGRRVTVNIKSGWWKDEFDAANVALARNRRGARWKTSVQYYGSTGETSNRLSFTRSRNTDCVSSGFAMMVFGYVHWLRFMQR
ncbi:LLM class flavin-dependent oxidoreductase [Paraburkholderia atlantica]|uniref:LLM class flavin-dependent oxidoreductase n=1 Tax=Paraburkholderia atlantica TaxID=2654982 RepID=UPI0006766369